MKVLALLLLLASLAAPQDTPDDPPVLEIKSDYASAAASEPGVVVIGSLKEGNHGHVVIVVPGSDPNRIHVYDGNILGALKDLSDGKKITNPDLLRSVNKYLTDEYDNARYQKALSKSNQKLPEEKRTTLLSVEEIVKGLTDDQKQAKLKELVDRYVEKGNSWTISYRESQRKEMKFFAAPTKEDVKRQIREYKPIAVDTVEKEDLRCNDLFKKVVPDLVPPKRAMANDIFDNLTKRADDTQKSDEEKQTVKPPREEPKQEIHKSEDWGKPVVPKPGGVIISATAKIENLDPTSVTSAAFDPNTGALTLKTSGGSQVTFTMDADDFAVAVRTVFVKDVDPSLSMSFGEKPGYVSVNYCGALFKTKFGRILYETDKTLGLIIFNREGPHRAVMTEILPDYPELVHETHETMKIGSRVFLHAKEATFAVEGDRLVCTGVNAKIDVEGLGEGATYYQKSLVQLARLLDEHYDPLASNFETFEEFRRLAQTVALAKWLKLHKIPFDIEPLKTRAVQEDEFPALVPADEWYALFNGRNLNGWPTNVSSSDMICKPVPGGIAVVAQGSKSVELTHTSWWNDFDLQYSIATQGPVELILPRGDSVTIDTKGKLQIIQAYFRKGEWTVIGPGVSKAGRVEMPDPKEQKDPNRFGLRIPLGSMLTLHGVSFRSR